MIPSFTWACFETGFNSSKTRNRWCVLIMSPTIFVGHLSNVVKPMSAFLYNCKTNFPCPILAKNIHVYVTAFVGLAESQRLLLRGGRGWRLGNFLSDGLWDAGIVASLREDPRTKVQIAVELLTLDFQSNRFIKCGFYKHRQYLPFKFSCLHLSLLRYILIWNSVSNER